MRELPDIVVIDDDPDALVITTESLQDAGLRVRAFHDPSEALQSITERPPGLVLTDINMAPLDGIELTRTLRATPHLAMLPIVAVSGRARPPAGVIECFDAYLRKPVEPRLIVEMARAITRNGATPLRAIKR